MFEKARIISSILKAHGFECFVAGGAVRDRILGLPEKDIDLSTNAAPDEMLSIFKKLSYTVVQTGIKHGTLTILVDSVPFEVTTYRSLIGASPLLEDSNKRDFTMNAIYLNLESNEYFDPHSGQQAIKDKIISYVLDPEERIQEDALRVLRAYRFVSTLGFTLEIETLKASARHLFNSVAKVSPERIRDELIKILSGEHLDTIFVSYQDLFFAIIPELRDCDGCCQKVALALPCERPLLRLAALLHEVAKPLSNIMERLKFSNREIQYVSFLVEKQIAINQIADTKAARRFIRDTQKRFFSETQNILMDLCSLSTADRQARDAVSILKMELERKEIVYESPLSGGDIMDLCGIVEGKAIGLIKEYLVEQIINGELHPQDIKKAKALALKYYESL
ncbi:MAG: CCA tRNA nucleotidyltransferase [Pseudomonadota bacterium]